MVKYASGLGWFSRLLLLFILGRGRKRLALFVFWSHRSARFAVHTATSLQRDLPIDPDRPHAINECETSKATMPGTSEKARQKPPLSLLIMGFWPGIARHQVAYWVLPKFARNLACQA